MRHSCIRKFQCPLDWKMGRVFSVVSKMRELCTNNSASNCKVVREKWTFLRNWNVTDFRWSICRWTEIPKKGNSVRTNEPFSILFRNWLTCLDARFRNKARVSVDELILTVYNFLTFTSRSYSTTIQKAQFWETKQRFHNFYFVIGTDVFRLFLGWAAIEGMRNVNIDLFYKWDNLKKKYHQN